jgi:hypothetical protein
MGNQGKDDDMRSASLPGIGRTVSVLIAVINPRCIDLAFLLFSPSA